MCDHVGVMQCNASIANLSHMVRTMGRMSNMPNTTNMTNMTNMTMANLSAGEMESICLAPGSAGGAWRIVAWDTFGRHAKT